MKLCLHCKREFQEQKETAKYCSTSCRVMYNRNKPKVQKGLSTESKLEVLCNTVMDMLSNIKYSQTTPNSYDGLKVAQPITHDELPMFPSKPKIKRSYENYQQLKLDCESVEAWQELKAEILASDLPQRQKVLLTT